MLDGMTIADALGRRVPFDGGDGDGVVSVVRQLTLELLAADVRSGLYGLVSQDYTTEDSTALPPGLLAAMGEQGTQASHLLPELPRGLLEAIGDIGEDDLGVLVASEEIVGGSSLIRGA